MMPTETGENGKFLVGINWLVCCGLGWFPGKKTGVENLLVWIAH